MKKVVIDFRSVFSWIFITLLFTYGLVVSNVYAGLEEVRELHSTTHTKNMPSQIFLIRMVWSKPLGETIPDGYYTLFNKNPEHEFNEFNSAGADVNMVTGYEVISPDYSDSDDQSYYFHIASFTIDNEGTETIGDTTSYGPFRIDTIAPSHARVTAPEYTSSRTITLNLGVSGATEMYISNVQYEEAGKWEDWSESKQWDLPQDSQESTIYVLYRDRAGNIAKASTKIIYDSLRPSVYMTSTATNPARITPIHISAIFNESISEFDASDISVSNGDIQGFKAVGQGPSYTTYEFDIIPSIEGSILINISENRAFDKAGNGNTASFFQITYDKQGLKIGNLNDIIIKEGETTDPIIINISNPSSYSGHVFVTVNTDNQQLILNSNISINGGSNSYTFGMESQENKDINMLITPVANEIGVANITIIVTDLTGITSTSSFNVTVKAVPVVTSILDQTTLEDIQKDIPFSITDNKGGIINICLKSSNSELVNSDNFFLTSTGLSGSMDSYSVSTGAGIRKNFILIISPENNRHGISTIEMLVTNAENYTTVISFSFEVSPQDDYPLISEISNTKTDEGQSINIPFSIKDPDGGELVINVLSSNSSVISRQGISITGTGLTTDKDDYYIDTQPGELYNLTMVVDPLFKQSGFSTITISISDESGLETTSSFAIQVAEIFYPPVISNILKQTTVAGNQISVHFTLSDADGDMIILKASSKDLAIVPDDNIYFSGPGLAIGDSYYITPSAYEPISLTLNITPVEDVEGETIINLTALDSTSLTDSASFELMVLDENSPPEISPIGNQTKPEGNDAVINFSITDADGDTLTMTGSSSNYTLISMNDLSFYGQGVDFKDGTYIVQTTPGESQSITLVISLKENKFGQSNISINLFDKIFEDRAQFQLIVTEINNPPTFPDGQRFQITENISVGAIVGQVSVSDQDNEPLSYTIASFLETFTIDPTNGIIRTISEINYEQYLSYTLTVIVSDKYHSVSKPVGIIVNNINEAPKISGTPSLTIYEDMYYSFNPVITDEDASDHLAIIIDNKPEWAVFNNTTGALTGTPNNDHVGIFENILISVSDNFGLSAFIQAFSIQVINTNDPPTLSIEIPDQRAKEAIDYRFELPYNTFIDIDTGDVLSYKATLSSGDPLPGWLNFTPATRTFSGKPTIDDIGTLTIKVTASDNSMASSTDFFDLEIRPLNQNPTINLNLASDTINYTENSTGLIIAPGALAMDNDFLDFLGGKLVVDILDNMTANDIIQIFDHGYGNLPIGLDVNKIYKEYELIGTFTGGQGIPLTITFSNNAHILEVISVIKNINYKNTSENPLSDIKKLRFVLSDGDGGVSIPAYVNINAIPINDDPIVLYNGEIIESDKTLEGMNEREIIYFSSATNTRIYISDFDAGQGELTISITSKIGNLNIAHNEGWIITGGKNLTYTGEITNINNTLNTMTYEGVQSGNETISILINDNGNTGIGGGTNIERTLSFKVHNVNTSPQISEISDQNTMEDTTLKVALTITDSDMDIISLYAFSSIPSIISEDNIIFSGSGINNSNTNQYYVSTSPSGNASISVDITPEPDQYGKNDITIYAGDGEYTISKIFSVTVSSVNDKPTNSNLSLSLLEDTIKTGKLEASDVDNDQLIFSINDDPQKGTVVIIDENTGDYTYTPDLNLNGEDSFTFKAFDGQYWSDIASVIVSIIPQEDAPKISNILDQLSKGQKLIQFLVYDPDDEEISVSASSSNSLIVTNDSEHLVLENDGSNYSLIVRPASNMEGSTNITITARDNEGNLSSEEFKFTVIINDTTPPVITLNGNSVVTIKKGTVYYDAGANASDDFDGNISGNITSTNNVNVYKPGIYQYLYSLADSSGNTSKQVLRHIVVYDLSYKTISGNITDETGKFMNQVLIEAKTKNDVLLDSDISDYSGKFELDQIPDSGEIIYLYFSRFDCEPRQVIYSGPESLDSITIIHKNSNNIVHFTGNVRRYNPDNNEDWLEGVEISVVTNNSQGEKALALSDENGQFSISLDKRMMPYTFIANKNGFVPETFSSNTHHIQLIEKTKIIVNSPQSQSQHNDARSKDRVEIRVQAEKPFKGSSIKPYEFKILSESQSSINNISFGSGFYTVRHSKYESFSLTIKADTTEDSNVNNGYYAENQLIFNAIPQSSSIYPTSGTIDIKYTEPLIMQSLAPDSNVFVNLPVNSISDAYAFDKIQYTIRELSNFSSSSIVGKIVEFEFFDESGKNIGNTGGQENPFLSSSIALDIVLPVTKSGITNKDYEIVYASSANEILDGQGQVITNYSNLSDASLIVNFSNSGAFGFRKVSSIPEIKQKNSGGGGGCFIDVLWYNISE